mgnify:CR=1 FL=1
MTAGAKRLQVWGGESSVGCAKMVVSRLDARKERGSGEGFARRGGTRRCGRERRRERVEVGWACWTEAALGASIARS